MIAGLTTSEKVILERLAAEISGLGLICVASSGSCSSKVTKTIVEFDKITGSLADANMANLVETRCCVKSQETQTLRGRTED